MVGMIRFENFWGKTHHIMYDFKHCRHIYVNPTDFMTLQLTHVKLGLIALLPVFCAHSQGKFLYPLNYFKITDFMWVPYLAAVLQMRPCRGYLYLEQGARVRMCVDHDRYCENNRQKYLYILTCCRVWLLSTRSGTWYEAPCFFHEICITLHFLTLYCRWFRSTHLAIVSMSFCM